MKKRLLVESFTGDNGGISLGVIVLLNSPFSLIAQINVSNSEGVTYANTLSGGLLKAAAGGAGPGGIGTGVLGWLAELPIAKKSPRASRIKF